MIVKKTFVDIFPGKQKPHKHCVLSGFLAAPLKYNKHVLVRVMQEFTERLAAVQSRSKAAGVGVDGDVGGRGVQLRVPDDDRVDDALTGDGVEHGRGHIR